MELGGVLIGLAEAIAALAWGLTIFAILAVIFGFLALIINLRNRDMVVDLETARERLAKFVKPDEQQSPAAWMSGSLVRIWSSQRIPLLTARPEIPAISVIGRMPALTTTMSVARLLPSLNSRPLTSL